MQFRVLGPLEVRDGNSHALVFERRKPRVLLALLLFWPNRVVSTASLMDGMWGAQRPQSAAANLQNYVAAVRSRLDAFGVSGQARLQTGRDGYLLRVDDDELDVTLFEKLARQGHEDLQAGEPTIAADRLATALELWRGPVLDGLPPPDVLQVEIARLDDLRTRASEDQAEARIELGLHSIAVADLRALTNRHPLRERPWALLMLALHRSGRTDEAIATYERAQQVLDTDLGVEPGPQLRRMRESILNTDPALDPVAAPRTHISVRPRQLPADVTNLVGRDHQLSIMDDLLCTPQMVTAVVGQAGAGKTALGVRWAHRVAEKFPDGQLFVDLQGHSATPPLRPIDVLTRFLRALGVRTGHVPAEEDDAAAMYRSVLADRRILIVLDNAANSKQVRPLLPGTTSCAVLVTSRDNLMGLAATHDIRHLQVAQLAAADSHSLLASFIGEDRMSAEPAAAEELVRLSAGLPLALRIVAANVALRPDRSLAGYLTEMTSDEVLDHLRVPGDEQVALRSAFDLSYDVLPAQAARLFDLLGLVPGHSFSMRAAAELAGIAPGQAQHSLQELVAGHLVSENATDRFGMHDLLRRYASLHASQELPEDDRVLASERLFQYYQRNVDNAASALYPDFLRLAPALVTSTSPADALQWLRAEQANLVEAIRWAGQYGPLPYAWRLADSLRGFFHSHRLDPEWQEAAHTGLLAAQKAGDDHAIGAMRHSLGALAWSKGDNPRALEELAAAQSAYHAAGARSGEDSVLHALGAVHLDLGELNRAIDHFEDALTAATERGTQLQLANSFINLGAAYLENGNLREGIRHNERALEICREHDSRHAAATAMCNLGYGYCVAGRPDDAISLLTEALETWRELGSRDDEADALARLAGVYLMTGRQDLAEPHARRAVAAAVNAGNRRFEVDALCCLAATLGQRNYYTQALRLAREIRYRKGEIEALIGLGTATTSKDAFVLAETGGFRVLAAHAQIAQARTAGPADAADLTRKALRTYQETGHKLGAARALAELENGSRPPEARAVHPD